ncbi:MAG TPA: rhodanese-related sulfurtransferase [Candidatus Saccharibacteria bacterium]|jgi:UPF0176 protein|nr:rhodanese-related sulfurtransferase [Candidatus Saccharibacteria bacterium]
MSIIETKQNKHAEEKVILFFKFIPLADPETVMFWQRELCAKLNLTGRILVSKHGINGTLGGNIDDLKTYKKTMNSHPKFKGIVYKWSKGGRSEFPKLKVKVKPELVAFEASDEVELNENGGVKNGGEHLRPEQVHDLVEKYGDDVIFYDGRNAYEARIGRFKNTVIPNVETSRDFLKDIESGEISKLKDKHIITYCTGGIRCEILSVLMKNRGYKHIYQIKDGIVKYGETFGDEGLWEGKLFVFDDRMQMGFTDKAKDIAECETCGAKTSRQINIEDIRRKLKIECEKCAEAKVKA